MIALIADPFFVLSMRGASSQKMIYLTNNLQNNVYHLKKATFSTFASSVTLVYLLTEIFFLCCYNARKRTLVGGGYLMIYFSANV